MISVCIPVYNYDAVPLARSLAAQAAEVAEGVELVCVDDGSLETWRVRNREVLGQLGKYIELEENVGRARVRNLFLQYAQGEWLLFLDVDSEVGEGFLSRYAEALKTQSDVVVGGRVYDRRGNDKAHKMRYMYGTQVESRTVEQRRRQPYRSFMTNNFMVKRSVLEQLPFDERIVKYGHEDTLFGYRLQQAGVKIEHIDNAVVNGEVENNEEFLRKSTEAVESLTEIYATMKDDEAFCHSVRLLDAYGKLKRRHLTAPVKWAYRLMKRPLESHFLAGEAISVKQFNFYKLGLFIERVKCK